MKWGVSRGRGSSPSSSTPSPSSDHLAAEATRTKIRTGGLHTLSNEELQGLNTRMQLEQTHRNLNAQAPSKFDTGHKHVKRVLSTVKTLNDIHSTVNGPIGKAIKTAVTK